eukprot:5989829-Lingulodinium_polyedra.AAC.1
MQWPCSGHAVAMQWPCSGHEYVGQFDLVGLVFRLVRSVVLRVVVLDKLAFVSHTPVSSSPSSTFSSSPPH